MTRMMVIFKLLLTNERLLGPQRVGIMYDPFFKESASHIILMI